MKKLLIMLMVVAMASFLFVGCLPGVVTPVEDEEDEEEVIPTEPTTVAPIITSITDIDITSSKTQYVNKADAADGMTVAGTAPTYSEVRVYIDAICAGTADVGATGAFSVVVAKADLGADGDKVLYATAKEAALAVSAKTTEYAFTLDTDLPGITEVKATAFKAATYPARTVVVADPIAADPAGVTYTTTALVPGTWAIDCLKANDLPLNVKVVSPLGTAKTYNVLTLGVLTDAIPGLKLTFNAAWVAGNGVLLAVLSTNGKAIVDRASLEFDEEVTIATASVAGNYTFTAVTGTSATPTWGLFNESTDTAYWNTWGTPMNQYDTIAFAVNGISDLAGNTLTTAVSATCIVGAASATALKP